MTDSALRATILFLGLPLLAAGCSLLGDGSEVCTTEAFPAIVVEVTNASTGAPVAPEGIEGVVVDGSYTDSLRTRIPIPYDMAEGGTVLGAALGRSGTYDVRLKKSGFALWTRSGVEVESNTCHVKTKTLEAQLEPTD